MAQYAGGALAASFLSGMAAGYCDPLENGINPVTYSMGDADPSSFCCNRAGMLLGVAISINPASLVKQIGTKVTGIALREISSTLAVQTEKVIVKEVTKKTTKEVTKKAAQKTIQMAEGQFVKRGSSSLNSFMNPLKDTVYSPKVLRQMRVNARTAQPDFHAFPRIVDRYAGFGRRELIRGRDGLSRTKITLPGGYQDKNGYFEWIIESNNTINHRIFIIE